MPTVATWLYTLDADGASVRMPITLRRGHAPMIDYDAVEPYHEPPLRAQMPTRQQRQAEHFCNDRMRRNDNRVAYNEKYREINRKRRAHGASTKAELVIDICRQL